MPGQPELYRDVAGAGGAAVAEAQPPLIEVSPKPFFHPGAGRGPVGRRFITTHYGLPIWTPACAGVAASTTEIHFAAGSPVREECPYAPGFTASIACTCRLNPRRFSPDNRATLANEIERGLIDWPFRHTSQCRCGPVDRPVEPI